MSADIHDALDVCLEAMQTGVELDRCLALYPDLSDELRPALESAVFAQMMSPPPPPSESQSKSRTLMLGRAADLREHKPSRSAWGLSRLAFAGLTAVFVFFVGAGSLVSVSAQSLPGDTLYPAKQASENFSLSFAPNASVQRELKERYLARRTDEIRQLIAQGRAEEVVFRGMLTSIENGRWMVDDIVVLIPDDMDIPDELSHGVKLEVVGEVQPEGWVEAEHVTVKVYKLDGEVKRIEADTWFVGDLKISITDLSLIENGVQVGDKVLVLVNLEEDEGVTALAIIKGIRIEGDQGSRSDDGSIFDEFDEDDPFQEQEDESDGDEVLEDGGEEAPESESPDDDEDKGDEPGGGEEHDEPEEEEDPEEYDPEEEDPEEEDPDDDPSD